MFVARLAGHGASAGPAQESSLALGTYLVAEYSVFKVPGRFRSPITNWELFGEIVKKIFEII